MKPGAVLFFVDNDGGGFREIIAKYALKFNFITINGSLKHENYTNLLLKTRRFGAFSCHKTTVSVTILQKPHANANLYINISPGSRCSRTVNLSNAIEQYNAPLTPLFPGTPVTPLFSTTPLTPYVYCHQDNYALSPIHNQPINSRALPPLLPDPPMHNPPIDSAFYSSSRHHSIYTPETPRPSHSRISNRNGCLPLSKFRHWRHHLSTKLDSFKSRIQSKVEKRKRKKSKKNNKDSK